MRRVGRLHVLTDITRQDRHDHAGLARLALEGGADAIQFREKRGATRGMIAIARVLAGICRDRGACLIVNDRLDVALAADAEGVHLGREDFPLSLARRVLGPDRVIGASAETVEEALEGMRAGADYIGAGPVYVTGSKPDASPPIGLEGLRAIACAVEIPVIAIGGVTVERVPEILAAGAYGIAVIEAVACDPDPVAATRRLREALAVPAPGGRTP